MWKTKLDHRGHIIGKIGNKEIEFLVNTGVTLSLLNFIPKDSMSQDRVTIQGATRKGEHALSKPLLLLIGNKGIWGRFVIAEESPACLLGRDLLQALDVQLHLSPRGTDLIIAGLCVVSDAGESELKIPEELKDVPQELWSKSGRDVGLLKTAQPVHIKTEGGSRPVVKQYPVLWEAEKSIQKQINQYLVKGILKQM